MNYALLIGINTYKSESIKNLNGCVTDIQRFEKYLNRRFGEHISLKTLLNEQATRDAIIHEFQTHLTKAGENDLVLFYFSGHGSQERSPAEFRPFQEDDFHETLVCHDSRTGPYDLADKELKYLIHNVAKQGAEVVVIIDACHSGSATRDSEDLLFPMIRQAAAGDKPRPLSSFLEGSADFRKVPRHLLMAACRRYQQARECRVGIEGKLKTVGLFSYYLLEALESSNSLFSYRDLMFRCESIIRTSAVKQTPIHESFGSFNTFRQFLHTGKEEATEDTYLLTNRHNRWQVNVGILHGLDINMETAARFAIYEDKQLNKYLGMVETHSIMLESSDVNIPEEWKNTLDIHRYYIAVPLYLPVRPYFIHLNDQTKHKPALEFSEKAVATQKNNKLIISPIQFVAHDVETFYEVKTDDSSYQLLCRDSREDLLEGNIPRFLAAENQSNTRAGLDLLLKNLIQWERLFSLAPQFSRLSRQKAKTKFQFTEYDMTGRTLIHSQNHITIDYRDGYPVPYSVTFSNRSDRNLFISLFYLDRKFGIELIDSMKTEASAHEKTLLEDDLYIPSLEEEPGLNQVSDIFKLIVSSKQLQHFNPAQESLPRLYQTLQQYYFSPESISSLRDRVQFKNNYRNWFCETMVIRTLRRLGRVGEKDLSIAKGKIVFKGHSRFKAAVSLRSTSRKKRSSPTDYIISDTLRKLGYTLVNFSDHRQLETILDLHHVEEKEVLVEEPLRIILNPNLNPDEYLVALCLPPGFFNQLENNYFMVAGAMHKMNDGKVEWLLNEFIPSPKDGRSIPGKSMQISFVKVNQDTCEQLHGVKRLEIGELNVR